jgi:hypothetical protein
MRQPSVNSLESLVSLASGALAEREPSGALLEPLGPRGLDLLHLLERRNGFYAFESALHVFGGGDAVGRGLGEWNGEQLWGHAYGPLAEGYFFFAEDVFGGQFAIRGEGIVQFDPETGDATGLAATLEDWAQAILDDYEVLTGHPLAHEWQVANGPIPPGSRLVPAIPFVLGGVFEIENLVLLDAAQGMRLRGELAQQLHDVPDGTQVSFRITD